MKLRLTPSHTIIVAMLFLNLLSIFSLYSSLHQGGEFRGHSIFYKQIMWIALSWLILILFSFINYRFFYAFSFLLYTLNIILLLVVIFFGKTVMGAQRWISFAGITFQPSEISKATMIFILARCFSIPRKSAFLKGFLLPFSLVLLNALLIFKQPDLGTAFLIVIAFFLIGFASPLRKIYFVLFIIVGILITPLGWGMLKEYQKKRLIVFLDPTVDPLGAGYTIIQSKIAIGSGKIMGKGFLSGTQNQFNFLPERHTDFIFTVVAEEWGLLGGLFLLLIYWFILKKILEITRDLKDPFAHLFCCGISILFFLHIFINIGMTLGILPVVGLPLIFLSYGGSHLLVSYILMGIFFNIVRSRH